MKLERVSRIRFVSGHDFKACHERSRRGPKRAEKTKDFTGCGKISMGLGFVTGHDFSRAVNGAKSMGL
jgi:hypothetical protein